MGDRDFITQDQYLLAYKTKVELYLNCLVKEKCILPIASSVRCMCRLQND